MRRLFIRVAIFCAVVCGVASAQDLTTPNLHLNTPPVNSPGWGPLVNQNAVLLDSFLSGVTQLPSTFWVEAMGLYNCKPSGITHGSGFLPDAGSTAGSTRFLREDCSWATPPGGDGGGGIGITITGAPAAGLIVIADTSTTGHWGQLTADNIAPGFSITSFSGGSTVELGASVINPAFIAAYSATPTSASITNTASINSPHVLATPFTSAIITGTIPTSSIGCTTFTLTAVGASTKTATQSVCAYARTFGGDGTPGATGITASGTSASLVGATGTLASIAVSASNVGGIYPVTPSAGHDIYLVLVGCGHTMFLDFNTGFSFAMKPVTCTTYTNANGITTAVGVYESAATFSGGGVQYSVKVVN